MEQFHWTEEELDNTSMKRIMQIVAYNETKSIAERLQSQGGGSSGKPQTGKVVSESKTFGLNSPSAT